MKSHIGYIYLNIYLKKISGTQYHVPIKNGVNHNYVSCSQHGFWIIFDSRMGKALNDISDL